MGARRRALGHDRQREAEDPGQGGHPARPAAPHLRGQTVGRWPHPLGLQHPEGVDAPPRPAPPVRKHQSITTAHRLNFKSSADDANKLYYVYMYRLSYHVMSVSGWNPTYFLVKKN